MGVGSEPAPVWRPRARRLVRSIACQVVSAEGEFRLLSDEILELSATGMLVRARPNVPVRLGEPVVVSFRTPGSERYVDACARVVRQEPIEKAGEGEQLALTFSELDPFSRSYLQARVEHLRTEVGPPGCRA